jgi:phage-related protein
MRRKLAPGEKPLFWIGSSKRDLLAMPDSVLHCFQKKSPSGTRTAKTDVEMIERRLKMAKADYEVRYGQASQKRE